LSGQSHATPDLSRHSIAAPDAKSVREMLGLSQVQFAALIGISPRTLQNREQGHRRPEGTARALLRVAESHPQAMLEALHR
jgi:putative transcriptional regulator